MSRQSACQGYVIYINWDGFAYEWYERVNRSYAGTPNLNSLLGEGVLFTNASTGIPSITGAIQQAIVSGAWPADTGNCYKHYHADTNTVIQNGRENVLENVAEAAIRHGVSTASVNAWYFENRGSFAGNPEKPYITAVLPSNFSNRVDELIRIINGEPVVTGERTVVFDAMPRLLSVYADDIDTVGHNGKVTYDGLQVADTREQWYDNIMQTIMRMDRDLGRLLEALKARDLYKDTTFVLATDHGMMGYGADMRETKDSPCPPEAYTCLYDLVETVACCGQSRLGRSYRVEVLPSGGMRAQPDTEIVLVPVAQQVQMTFRSPLAAEAREDIAAALKSKSYYGIHLVKEELIRRGAAPGYADLLLSARPPYHFRPGEPDLARTVCGNHDSLEKQVQHIFLMVAGAQVVHGAVCDEPVTIVDIAPTIARMLGFEGPSGAVGTALDAALMEPLRGPELEVRLGNVGEEAAEDDAVRLENGGEAAEDDVVRLTGRTSPGARIRINGRETAQADREGRFEAAAQLECGVNRLVVEAMHRGRLSRRTLYAERTASSGAAVAANANSGER